MSNPSIYGRGLGGLLKRGWNEIPEVMASGVVALVGFGFMGAALQLYYSHDLDNRRYKLEYTVYREDDPKAAKVRKD